MRFHEGIHGLDFIEFLENHPPMQFRRPIGMTIEKLTMNQSDGTIVGRYTGTS
jgi:hypothetical protein